MPTLKKTRTEKPVNEAVAGLKQVSVNVSKALGAAFQIQVTENTPCAVSVVDECINICNNTFTSTSHGFAEGLKGQISVTIGSAKATPAACFDTCCNIITEACHGFTTGERGRFTTSCTLPDFCCCTISACTCYYIISLSACTYNVATSRANALAGTGVCITGAGVGNHTFTPNGALPCGVCACTDYFIIKDDANTFRVATSRANAQASCPTAVSITALNAPAATVFTPTAASACCSNGTITFHPSVDRATYPSCTVISAVCLDAGMNTNSVTNLSGIYYNDIQIDIDATQGQYCIEIDVSVKEDG